VWAGSDPLPSLRMRAIGSPPPASEPGTRSLRVDPYSQPINLNFVAKMAMNDRIIQYTTLTVLSVSALLKGTDFM